MRHPDLPSRFVLGIECDGAAYHSAKSARDRDRLRQEALERLGWRLTRVWSTDWFHDTQGQTERLSREIEEAVRVIDLSSATRERLVEIDRTSREQERTAIAEHRIAVRPVQERELPLLPIETSLVENAQEGQDLRAALCDFRERIVTRGLSDADPARSILRDCAST